jgi:hypothetical protein
LASSTFLQRQFPWQEEQLPSEGKGHTFESCRVRQYYQAFS